MDVLFICSIQVFCQKPEIGQMQPDCTHEANQTRVNERGLEGRTL